MKEPGSILEEFRSRGLANASIDPEGNVIGLRDGASDSALVISAHIDTVFPIETNVEVQRRDGRLYGPGIVDDALGLATMLGLIDAVNNTDLETQRLIFDLWQRLAKKGSVICGVSNTSSTKVLMPNGLGHLFQLTAMTLDP
ncbi:MAG: M20/M25/M40 family metallo-hydrolase [Porticoccaceae bacterium]